MGELRDYEEWHTAYDDPGSTLSWRLRTVQDCIRRAIEGRTGPIRVLSSCAGDGRDILGVLAGRDDGERFTVTLIELHPGLAARARSTAASLAARAQVEVRTADAGNTDAYADAAPADLVLMVGVFGNITDEDLARTIEAMPQLCTPGATLIWTRGRDREDRNDQVRAWFAASGFAEIEYATLDRGGRPAVGVVRYDGPARPFRPGVPLFTFVQ
jgi:Methyltransferase domain